MRPWPEPEVSDALQNIVQRARAAVGAPGLAVGISGTGKRAYGVDGNADSGRSWPLRRSSRFGIACVTKLLVAIVANKLAETGELDLSNCVERWIPELAPSGTSGEPVTLTHLLTHTAGYQGPLIFGKNYREFEWSDFRAGYTKFNRVFRPGAVFNYENTGHVILGQVIKCATGIDVNDLIRDIVLQPLGIVPGKVTADFGKPEYYVAPHRLDNGIIRTVAPSVFGHFWRASLSDYTLTLDDMLTVGEALLGHRREVDFSAARTALFERMVDLPHCVSGKRREHAPLHFNRVCAEYGSGWFGYAGSVPGQTVALRFDVRTGTTCVVALNSWLPLARDALIDRLCAKLSHPDAGSPGGNEGYNIDDLQGEYIGGGNIIRSVTLTKVNDRELECRFGPVGLPGSPLRFLFDQHFNLVPDPDALIPNVGFFADPHSRKPCLMIGLASLKRSDS